VRTTLTLDEDVAAKLDAEVRRSGRSLKAVVNEALRLGLLSRVQGESAPKFAVKAKALGLRPGLSYESVGDLLDAAEGALRK
jgi:hypothetical protein